VVLVKEGSSRSAVGSPLGSRIRFVLLKGERCASEMVGRHVERLEGGRCEFAEDGALCVSCLGKGVVEAVAHSGVPRVVRSRRHRLQAGSDVVTAMLRHM